MTESRRESSSVEPADRRPTRAAVGFGALTVVVVAFQVALAAGAPWGHMTMGGAFSGQLPTPMRVAAVVQALLLVGFALIVAARAGLILPRWHRASRKLIWVVVAYTVVGAVLNAATPSAAERALWLPVTLLLGVCAVVVARGR
jgi:hypothetical protein